MSTASAASSSVPSRQRQWLILISLFFGCIVLTKIVSTAGSLIANAVWWRAQHLDPEQVYLSHVIHHLFQAAVYLVLIVGASRLFRKPWREFGFNLRHFRATIPPLLWFLAFWTLLQVGVAMSMIYILKMPFSLPFSPTLQNSVPYLLFQLFLSGPSEEIAFRAFTLTVLAIAAAPLAVTPGRAAAMAIALSTVVFMIAHVSFTFSPFRITHFNILQQVVCLISSIFYGWLLVRYETIATPMIAHSMLNVISVGSSILLFVTYPLW